MKLFFIVLLYIVLLFAIESVFYFTVSGITKIPVNELIREQTMQRTAVILCSKAILLIICAFLSSLGDHEQTINKKAGIFLSLMAVFLTAVSGLMYVMLYFNMNDHPQVFYIVFFIIMLIMILIIYFSVMNIMRLERQKQEYAVIEKQNQLINNSLKEQESTFELWKQSIHDYKNKMAVLDGLLESGEYQKAHDIIENELEIFKDKAFYISTGNKAVDIILNVKMNLARQMGITFTVNILLNNELPIKDMDICVLLGNLIDNAIEAVENEKEKVIHVQMNFVKELFVIKIMNTYSKENFSAETSKSDSAHHGIGLKSVHRTVEKYNGNFSITLNNGHVTALVTI